MELSLEEARAAQGLIMSEAHRISKGRRITSDDYKQATAAVAKNHYSLSDPNDLNVAIGNQIGRLSGTGRRNKNADDPQKLPANIVRIPEDDAPEGKRFFVSLYREWVNENDVVPDDRVLTHFTGFSSPSYIRSDLRKEGYEFEHIGKEEGYRITKRPVKIRTLEDIMQELADALKAGAQIRVASLMMEMMQFMQCNGGAK